MKNQTRDRRVRHVLRPCALTTGLTRAALRETAEVKADPEALRALAEARQAVPEGDVVYGTDAVRALLRDRRAS